MGNLDTQRERRPCDVGDRDWRDQGHLGSRQGMPRIAEYHQKPGTDKGGLWKESWVLWKELSPAGMLISDF